MLLHIFVHLLILNALFLLVELVLLADGHEGRPDHSLHEGGQDQGDDNVEGAEHNHHKSVAFRSSGGMVEGYHGPPSLSKHLEHHQLSIKEVIEVRKLVVHSVVC